MLVDILTITLDILSITAYILFSQTCYNNIDKKYKKNKVKKKQINIHYYKKNLFINSK